MTYRVCMQLTEGDERPVIEAVVTMDQYSNLKLVSWKHSDVRQLTDAFRSVPTALQLAEQDDLAAVMGIVGVDV